MLWIWLLVWQGAQSSVVVGPRLVRRSVERIIDQTV